MFRSFGPNLAQVGPNFSSLSPFRVKEKVKKDLWL